MPIPVAARSKASVYGRSLAEIVGSNTTEGHGCASVVSVLCCQVKVSATSWSHVQRSLTECGVSECDRESSTMRRPWPTGGGLLRHGGKNATHDWKKSNTSTYRLVTTGSLVDLQCDSYKYYHSRDSRGRHVVTNAFYKFQILASDLTYFCIYRGADKSLARPTCRCILFDGENISFDASLVMYINSTNIPPIMIINRIYKNQYLLSL